eukprot:9373780-Pyramimonas_sp.AAC.1
MGSGQLGPEEQEHIQKRRPLRALRRRPYLGNLKAKRGNVLGPVSNFGIRGRPEIPEPPSTP